MSYICARRTWKSNTVKVWVRDEETDQREMHAVPAIFDYYVKDTQGEYLSVFGDKLSHRSFMDCENPWEAFEESLKLYKLCPDPLRYESDIKPELKVLAKYFYNATPPKLHITLYDIENDYDPNRGYASIEDPYAPINAVALYHEWKKKKIVLVVPCNSWDPEDNHQLVELSEETDTEVVICEHEHELLLRFLDEIEDADCISGWNSDWFDTPYMCKRLEMAKLEINRHPDPSYRLKYNNVNINRMSFAEGSPPKFREAELYGQKRWTVDLGGRISYDYMELFKKFEQAERPSYSLDAISNEVLPDLPKLTYKGTLAALYNDDLVHFVRYNIRDTEVLKGFEEKLGYIQLANVLYHSSCGQPEQIFGTIKLADLAIVNHCHNELDNRKVPDWDRSKEDGQIFGAMVLPPIIGLHDWIGSIDITSLYPSAIRCNNISPEKIIGQMRGTLSSDDRGMHTAWKIIMNGDPNKTVTIDYEQQTMGDRDPEMMTGAEWREILYDRKWAISGFGTIFNQDNEGMIPAVLRGWFEQRKKYKKKMSQLKDAAEKATGDEKAQLKDKAAYYDRLQYVYKIKLNSLYGALTNFYFRFFDLRMGQSTTATGRAILDHMGSHTALMLDGEYSISSNSIIAGDTDSIYFATHADIDSEGLTHEQIIDKAVTIADYIGKSADASFNDFCKKAFCIQPEFENIIACDREVVAKRGIFVKKKHYVLKLVDLDGYRLDKLKVMGLKMKKTTTPKAVQLFLEDVVNKILDGHESWDNIDGFIIGYRKQVTETMPVFEIGLPKGVKNVEHYTSLAQVGHNPDGSNLRLPGHVAASIHYNQCLEEFGDKTNLPIISGTKIKIFYLTQKYGRFKSIAVPTDAGDMPFWFHDHFTVNRQMHEERLIDKNLEQIFVAIGREVPTAQSKLNNSLMEF